MRSSMGKSILVVIGVIAIVLFVVKNPAIVHDVLGMVHDVADAF